MSTEATPKQTGRRTTAPGLDLRSWLDELRRHGELLEIEEEVDWRYELGCIVRRVFDIPGGGPAVLFKNISGYQKTAGRKFFAGSLSSHKRLALMFGLPADASPHSLVQRYLQGLEKPRKATTVKTAVCKEVVRKEKEVDLLDFPVPHFHPMDGGRYMGTLQLVVTKDPDTGLQNTGVYRMMLHDRNHLGTLFLSRQDWDTHFGRWRARGERMPVAICFGPPQVTLLAAAAKLDHPPDEMAYAGGFAGRPIPLVKCEMVDLKVPADCEIVLEGYVDDDPKTFRLEGPLGEYMGYMGGAPALRPVITVTCLTHRKDPILQGTVEGRPVPGANEDHYTASLVTAGYALQLLRKHDIEALDAAAPLGAMGFNKVIVSVRQQRQGEAMQLASLLWGSRASFFRFKEVVVVDEDIDVHNPAMVEFAVATRVDPAQDITVVRGFPGIPLDPRIPPEEKLPWMGGGHWSRVLIDATRPYAWRAREEWGGRRFPPVQHWPTEIEDLVDEKWIRYGLGDYPRPPRWNSTY